MPAFAGMTVFLVDSVNQNHSVTPAKAGVPFFFVYTLRVSKVGAVT